MSVLDRPLVHPDRKLTGFQPIKAWRHFRKLVADKEDTEQVFHIIEALKGRRSNQRAIEFLQTETGQHLMRRGNDLPAMLDNHARWADCGPNSVAQHYIHFMTREGLSAAGLVEESNKFKPPHERPQDQLEWYFERLRDTHDLFHVLSGYGRDALGEGCLLGFSYEQNPSPGVLFICYAGNRELRKQTRTKAPVLEALREGRRHGKAAARLAHQEVEALMREDIDEARARLNIQEPLIYRECLKILESEGHMAEDLMGQEMVQAQAA
ncbi:Coq4 family protein [Altererythrobacter sp.]|uniref:Coq4 family protein n=1 Tax=Altererythrobacter sp. TaxID=1872480 RepID=UPI003D0AF0CC